MGILQTFAQLGQKCDMELRFKYLEMETLKEIYWLFFGVITAGLLLSCAH